eukprot:sb/3476296/
MVSAMSRESVSYRSRSKQPNTNQNSLFRSRDWLSANQGPVFPDSVVWKYLSQFTNPVARKRALLKYRIPVLCKVALSSLSPGRTIRRLVLTQLCRGVEEGHGKEHNHSLHHGDNVLSY